MADDQRVGVLFVYPNESSFVATDLRLLSKHFRVLPFRYRIEKGAGRRFLHHLVARRREYDIVFCWFGDIHATLAVRASRFLGKPVVVVAGGYDTTYIPSIRYGLLADKGKRTRAREAFSGAHRVIVVDKSLERELKSQLGLDGSNIQVVHTGYDPEVFKPSREKDSKSVLTVGAVNEQNLKRKGLETFARAAAQLPEFRFRLVGPWQDPRTAERLKAAAPVNLTLTGELDESQLVSEFGRAGVYAQLSMFEGLPNAVAEAMLAECVPVATPVCGIPTLVGDCGFYVPVGDPTASAMAIRAAAIAEFGPRARLRIANGFSMQRREQALTSLIQEFAGNGETS